MSDAKISRTLYEQDILLWLEDTVAKLKAQDFAHLDIEHLIEEVEALGTSQKKELLSRLVILLEHLLKRIYIPSPNNCRGWERTIRTQRVELQLLLDAAPSLVTRWEASFEKAWRIALKTVCREYPTIAFPVTWPYGQAPEEILDRDFWLVP
ncbi:MAG: DUF29 domain-containing protein [Gloeomargaritaceae cyanobacterium C42_A2020_066]|nr:DUF29 domain-containing protein [Gloeomargaritaceae cyanobacterium C42_A2020_066]